MKPITIRIAGGDESFPGSFIVEQDGHSAIALGWDEMLGQIIALTMRVPEVKDRIALHAPGLYPMETQEVRDAHKARWEKRRRGVWSIQPVVIGIDNGNPDGDMTAEAVVSGDGRIHEISVVDCKHFDGSETVVTKPGDGQ